MSKRKKTPKSIEAEVLLKSRRRCCLCVFLNGDDSVKKGQVAHLDGDPSNYNEDNLVFLCLIHHDEYDSKTSQSKGLTKEEVKHYRDLLYNSYVQETHAQKGVVEVHKSGTIEVGYNCFGATIGLSGTLRAIGRDSFISEIRLSLSSVKCGSVHTFTWGFSRQEEIAVENINRLSSSSPSAFMLPVSQPRDYDMLFIDTQLHDEIRPVTEKVRREWNRISSSVEGVHELSVIMPEIHLTVQQELKRLYVDFQKSNIYKDGYAFLEKHCYWKPGTYELQMHVKTSQPGGEFTKDWQFELTEQDACKLRSNAILILQDICGQTFMYGSHRKYEYVYVKYQPEV